LIAIMLFGSALWGLYWLPLRLIRDSGLSGLWTVALVYTGSTAVLLYLARGERRTLWRERRPMLGIGLTAAISGTAFSIGVIEGEVARVLILFYLSPVWSVILAHFLLREPLAPVTVPAVALALVGAVMMLLADTAMPIGSLGLADLLGLFAGLFFALTNVQLRAAGDLSPRLKNLAASVLVPPLAMAAALLLGQPFSAPPPAIIASLAVGVIWMSTMIAAVQVGVSNLPLQRSSVLLLFELVVGAVSAALLAGESLGPWEIAGGLCIVAAGLAVVRGRMPAAALKRPG
jgi:drug/metabolite transporter (DMT)-like permease